nr:unnamed protein product [Digitaria exilis]
MTWAPRILSEKGGLPDSSPAATGMGRESTSGAPEGVGQRGKRHKSLDPTVVHDILLQLLLLGLRMAWGRGCIWTRESSSTRSMSAGIGGKRVPAGELRLAAVPSREN